MENYKPKICFISIHLNYYFISFIIREIAFLIFSLNPFTFQNFTPQLEFFVLFTVSSISRLLLKILYIKEICLNMAGKFI